MHDGENNKDCVPMVPAATDPLTKSLSGAAGDLLKKALGPSAEVLGKHLSEMLDEWVWKRRNANKTIELAAIEVQESGLAIEDVRPIPEGDVYRAVNAFSLEDDETVQRLWAGLLAAAMDPNRDVKVSKAFVDILQAIGPVEAGLLLIIHKIDTTLIEQNTRSVQAFQEMRKRLFGELSEYAEQVWRRHSIDDQNNAIQNLMRLRCIGYRGQKKLHQDVLSGPVPFGVRESEVPASALQTARALDYVESLALAASGTTNMRRYEAELKRAHLIPEAAYDFTALGRSLMTACIRDIDNFNKAPGL